ncbi:MAG: 3-dehydroquinate synthase [Micavibrio sp.]|nr:3-dehydroquinate synthase [Micavibrio sp.]
METRILTINLDKRSYDIYVGAGLLNRIHDFVPNELGKRNIFVVTDKNVESYAQLVVDNLTKHTEGNVKLITLPAGEKTKSFEEVQKVSNFFLQNGLNRNSMVIAVGGGVIGDLTGFCASIAMRGVPYIQVPTTLLSQVDSSVGGKTGINTKQGKNLIGAFYQPGAVVADIETLKTLPQRELLAGYAEVFKYGLIQNRGFFEWLEDNADKVIALDETAVAYAIETSCRAKAKIVEKDEQERGRRALLNLGHTFGHALEAEAGYNGTLLHGEAVAIGTVMAFDLSVRLGLCPRKDLELVERHFMHIGLPTHAYEVEKLSTNVDRLIDIMRRDKKVVSGNMVFILVNGIGDAFTSGDVPETLVRDVLIDSLGGERKGGRGLWSSKFSSLS